MDKNNLNSPRKTDEKKEIKDYNQFVYEFLEEYNLKPIVTTIDQENPFIGDGFILTEKPLLKVQFVKKK